MHDGNSLRALLWDKHSQIYCGRVRHRERQKKYAPIVRRAVKRIESLGFKMTLEQLTTA
jgi:hypothetical protein